MPDERASREFFNRVNEQGFDARLGRARGTLRLDVDDGGPVEHWLVSLDRGAIHVSRVGDTAADCVVRLDQVTLDGIVSGDVNPTAALLRGAIAATGNIDLLLYLQRLFPAERDAHDAHRPWPQGGMMGDSQVSILDGNTFVVSDDCGDIDASPTDPTGLFAWDTRFLSQWVLTVNGERLSAVDRRAAVLPDALLPGAGHRNRLRRRQAVGDPAARRSATASTRS